MKDVFSLIQVRGVETDGLGDAKARRPEQSQDCLERGRLDRRVKPTRGRHEVVDLLWGVEKRRGLSTSSGNEPGRGNLVVGIDGVQIASEPSHHRQAIRSPA